ncbi:TonB-dependent receptor [Sphingomonas sp. NFX23]
MLRFDKSHARRLACAAALMGTTALLPSMAFGQTAPIENGDPTAAASGPQASANDDIVVTAQKRQQRLIDVPVPVSAISADTLTKQNLVSISDYFDRVPGLQYSGRRLTALSIRGINSGGAAGPTVAILIDDVPFSGANVNSGQSPIPDFDPATLDRIEVLRGPQGTLYGAASLGGLIKYVTHVPDTEKWSGRIEAGGNTIEGGNEGFSGRGTINVPIVKDHVALSLSGFYRRDPAWIDNINVRSTKDDVNTRDTWGGRAALLVKPTDNITLQVSALRQLVDADNSDLAITSGGIRVCPECQATGNTAITNYKPLYNNLTTINVLPSTSRTKLSFYTAKAEIDLGGPVLSAIAGWSKVNNNLNNDVSSIFGGLFNALYGASAGSSVAIANINTLSKFSQEVRLSDTSAKLDWLIGGFYTAEHSSVDQTLTFANSGGSTIAVPYVSTGPSRYREWAGFADATYHATDKLDLQVGGRYSYNKQSTTQALTIDTPAQAAFGPSTTITSPSKDGVFTWLVSPSYHINRDLLGYARVSTGYRPGGSNVGFANANATYGADKVTNYEVGLKGDAVPGILTFDASLFQIDWHKIQLQNTDSVSQLTFLTNGGEARSRGVEFTTRVTPGAGFSLDMNATYTDAVLTEDLSVQAGVTGLSGSKGDRIPFVPRWTFNVSPQKTFDLSSRLAAFVGASLTFNDDRASAFKTAAASATRPRFTLPSYVLIDLRAGATFDRVWELSVYARNVFNEFGVVSATNRNGTAAPNVIFTQPRTIGLTVARNF